MKSRDHSRDFFISCLAFQPLILNNLFVTHLNSIQEQLNENIP